MKKLIQLLNDKKKYFPLMAAIPLSLIYYEIIFNLSTIKSISPLGLLTTALFSISYGLAAFIIAALWKDKVNKIATSVIVFASAFVFGVEYFVYKYFKIFYDVKTVMGGAGDVVSGFGGVIIELMLSLDGIAKILLLLVPLAAYLYYSKKNPAPKPDGVVRIIAAALAVVCFASATI